MTDPTGTRDRAPDPDAPAEEPSAAPTRVADGHGDGDAARVAAAEDDPSAPSPDEPGDELGEPGPRSAIPRDRLAVSVAAVVAALALLWLAGESHYRSCVDAVQVRNSGASDALSRLARREDLESCSRLPF